MTRSTFLAAAIIVAVLVGMICSQETAQSQKKPKDGDQPGGKGKDITKVEKKPFKIEIALKGSLEAEARRREIFFRPQFAGDIGPLVIDKVVEHGTKVKQGDWLIAFDTQKMDTSIKDAKVELKTLEAAIKLASEDLPLAEKSVPMELAAAERAKKRADEDLSHFLEIARLQAEKSAQFAVQRAAFSLEYAREELRQLEKMYKSKDLTEDTEKIILKRQQNNVEAAEHSLKSTEVDRDLTLKVTLPRKDKDLREQALQKELALEKARATLGPSVAQKRQALAKMHNDRDKLLDRLQKLERDRANMVLTAPMDGIVYYGRLYRGQWTGADIMAGRLVPRKIAPADDTLMTVVQARPLVLRVAIEEKDLSFVKPGLEGNAQIASQPGRKLKVRVAKVSSFPSSPGKFEALVNLDPDDSLMPGLACSVNFIPYAKKDALVVAASAVFELDAKYYVMVMAGEGKRDIRAVTPGQTFNDYTEILGGLREGEEILSKGGNP